MSTDSIRDNMGTYRMVDESAAHPPESILRPCYWNTRRLKMLGHIYPGLAGKRGDDFSKEHKAGYSFFVPFVSVANYSIVPMAHQYVRTRKGESQNEVMSGDILFLMSSETLEDIAKSSLYMLEEDSSVYLNSFCKGFRPNQQLLDSRFCNYLLSSEEFRQYFAQNARGFTRINLKQEFILNAQVIVPPLAEQKAIATFLDQKTAIIDQAIKIKEQQILLLKERKQIIIQQAVTRGLNPDAPMKDSGIDWIGEIPAHWEIRRNAALFKESKAPGDETLPVLSVSIHSGVSDRELSAEENIRSAIKIENKASYKKVEPGYVAYNMMRAWQGGIGVVRVSGMVSPAYVVASPNTEYDGGYFELLYRTPAFIWQMDCYSKGITDFRKRLYWDEFKVLVTLFPPVEEQKEIVDWVELESSRIDVGLKLKAKQIDILREYKTTLINAAVTGRIKVA